MNIVHKVLIFLKGPVPPQDFPSPVRPLPFLGYLQAKLLPSTPDDSNNNPDFLYIPLSSTQPWKDNDSNASVDYEKQLPEMSTATLWRDPDNEKKKNSSLFPKDLNSCRTNKHVISLFLILTLLGFSLLTKYSYFASAIKITDYGDLPQYFQSELSRDTDITPIDWSPTRSAWSQNAGCGLDGELCLPFNGSAIPFRCPGDILSVTLHNIRTIGNIIVNYQPLVVGGGDRTYRADSFFCAAAVHAGEISNSGGCGILLQTGTHSPYVSSDSHGVSSLGFNADAFPSSFSFGSAFNLVYQSSHCKDYKYPTLAFCIATLVFFTLFFASASASLFYAVTSCIGFWYTAIFFSVSYPPAISTAMGSFLPTTFVLYGYWRMAFRHVLPAFAQAPLEKLILFLGPFWVGCIANLTLEQIPVDRLTAQDISKRRGGLISVIIIVIIIFFIVLHQMYVIRKTGWLPFYLKRYIIGGVVMGILASMPGFQLRIHHYIIGIVFLPGTAFPTRLSLIYQGLLLGLFLNGIARWGFASIIQTSAELVNDGATGSLLPTLAGISYSAYNTTSGHNSVIVSWDSISADENKAGWDGYGLMVNDVLRYQGKLDKTQLDLNTLDWGTDISFDSMVSNSSLSSETTLVPNRDMYFRLAYQSHGSSADFTKAATWKASTGEWIAPQSGPG